MYLRFSKRGVERAIQRSAEHPVASDAVEYPPYYLVHWHFIPGGYLSRRSAALYDHTFRRIYYAGQERRVSRRLARMVMHRYMDGRILELGCGPGRLLSAIEQAGPAAEITGVDLSPFHLERAARAVGTTLSPVRLVHADGANLPFADASYDVAVASHVLGHLPRDAASEVFAELHRVVRPGGRLLLFEHNWHRLAPEPWVELSRTRLSRTFGQIITLQRGA